jgi:hypothetical protein
MRNQFSIYRSALAIITFLCVSFSSHVFATPGNCPGSTVLWHDLSDNGLAGATNPGITMDVFNQNIDIQGRNALVNGIRVVASTCDILVTITNNDTIITGSGNRADGVTTGSARLYLFADTGHSITFSITEDLMFRGTATNNGALLLDLLVSVSGSGTVNFNILGEESVTFTSLPTTGGTRAYVAMKPTPAPDWTFSRMVVNAADQASNVEIGVGPRSLLSYISLNSIASNGGGTDLGTLFFDPTNTGTGRMILRVSDKGEVLISGRLLSASPGINAEFQIGDIDLTTPAGHEADFDVVNSSTITSGSLLIINQNTILTNFVIDPFCDGAFAVTGTQAGFILGSNGVVVVDNNTFIDYVGTTTNQCPVPQLVLSEELTEQGLDLQSIVKNRNPSAFIVDDSDDPNAVTPAILLSQNLSGGSAAVYFRSGVDEDGLVQETVNNTISFTIASNEFTPGEGNLVFDIEGDLDVIGNNGVGHQALHILSLQVTPTGGPVLVRSGETTFPLRTFATDANGDFLRYNSAYMMVNRRLKLNNVSLVHDDENHLVFEKNDVKSEPTYIGAERFKLIQQGICSGSATCNGLRPKIVFNNSYFRLNTSAAITGVDLLIPNIPSGNNDSRFVFYGNGRIVDNGDGRQLNLGTDIGSFACDGGTIISRDAHLDILQELADPTPGVTQLLTLTTEPNDNTVNNLITTPFSQLQSQASVHTIYLGHASNVSIGVNDTVGTDSLCTMNFALTTTPHLTITGCFLSFDTRGGTLCYPETSNVTGEGGIFVDTNGLFDIAPNKRVNISTMVTKSRNGAVRLPRGQVFFNSRVGISDWQLNLTDPAQQTIIASGVKLSDYTLDWIGTTKDYTTSNSLVPYELCDVNDCSSPAVVNENLRSLPVVQGTVDQLQIKRSRIGDAVHLKVSTGGYVKELVFLTGFDSAEAPVGFIVVEGDGRLGLGSAHRNVDSLDASIVLGVNGVTLVPNGNGEVLVNENLIVNNVCHILSGTSFGLTAPNFMSFISETDKEIRVKKGGILDLSSMTSTNQIIEFTGQLRLVMETGSTLRLGGGILQFSGSSQLIVQRSLDDLDANATTVSAIDDAIVSLVGTGTILMLESSGMSIHEEATLGVETYPTCTLLTTNIGWYLQDSSFIQVGSPITPGGVFQIGNTSNVTSASITFSLILNGIDASVQVGQRGFFGLGAGIIDKPYETPPNEWTIGSLFNVNNITISIPQGTFIYNSIRNGSDLDASLLAIGGNSNATFSFVFDKINSIIQGGANMVKIASTVTSIAPIVTSVNGTISSDLKVGIFSSEGQLVDPRSAAQPVNVSADALFDYLKVRDVSLAPNLYASPKACLARDTLGTDDVGYVVGSIIFRPIAPRIIGETGAYVDPRESLEQGSVGIILNADSSIATLNAFVK